MSRILLIFIFSVLTVFAEKKIFNGKWCVENEGINLTFTSDSSVSFSSDDETISGSGTYAFTDTTLYANIKNNDMKIEIYYAYKLLGSLVKVKTDSMKINDESVESSEEWFSLIQCNNELNNVDIKNEEK
jgi:hypothetical protein